MKLYQAGDRSGGVCEHCKAEVFTRMEYRDYAPTGWDVVVPDVLVAVCERCGRVVAVPHQSTPKVNEHRKRGAEDLEAVECRVSRAVEEVVDLVTASLGGGRGSLRPAILRYYLNLVADDPKIAEAIKRGGESGGKQKSDRRITIKIPRRQWGEAWSAARGAGVTSKSQLVRGIAGLAARDFGVSVPDGLLTAVDAGSSTASKARREGLRSLARAVL